MRGHRLTAGVILALVLMLAGVMVGEATPKIVEIVAGSAQNEFAFMPKEVSILAGQPVMVTVTNRGKVEHDFHIEALRVQVHSLISPGKSASVEFTVARRGTFEFYCRVPGHRGVGMKGVLVVR